MSIFDSLTAGPGKQQPQQITMQQARQQIMSDPASILKRAGLTVPANVNDPQQMVQYLFQSGQIGRNLRRVR